MSIVQRERIFDRISGIIRAIDYHLDIIKSLSNALTTKLQGEKIEDESFTVEIKYVPLGNKLVNAIFRIEPKIKVNEELLQLVYLSDIFLKDEPSILRAVSSGSWKKLGKGNNISFSIVIHEDIKDLEVRRIVRRFKRVFMAFQDDNLRKKLLQERKKLESLASNVKKKAKEVILTVMRINDLLFYESS